MASFHRQGAGFISDLREWIWGRFVIGLLAAFRLLPVGLALGLAGGIVRLIGPRAPRHRLVMANLERAFPEKSEAERRSIGLQSWANLGRMLAEYAFLDRLELARDPGDGDDWTPDSIKRRFEEIRQDKRPLIFFTAHTGCFEILPLMSQRNGVELTVLFRAPNNRHIAERLLQLRNAQLNSVIGVGRHTPMALGRVLARGGTIGILPDQKAVDGIDARFFGLPAPSTLLLAKFVRHFDCRILPVRSIRMPDGGLRVAFEDELVPPRDADGAIDIPALVQMTNDIVERWVREYPGQWLWYHDRWAIKREIGL